MKFKFGVFHHTLNARPRGIRSLGEEGGAGADAGGGGGGDGAPALSGTPGESVPAGGSGSGFPAAPPPPKPGSPGTTGGGTQAAPTPTPGSAPALLPKAAPTTGPDPVQAFLDAKFGEDDEYFGSKAGPTTGLPSYETLLTHATPQVKAWLGGIHRSYTQRMQDLSTRDGRISEQAAAMANEKQQLAMLSSPEFQQHLANMARGAEGADPFTKEGQEKIADARASELFQRLIKPVEQRWQQEQQSSRLEAYKAANPDLRDPAIKNEVIELLKEREHLTLEDAHQIVKGRRAGTEAERLRQTAEADRARRRGILERTGGGSGNTDAVAPPKFKDAWEAFQYHAARQGR